MVVLRISSVPKLSVTILDCKTFPSVSIISSLIDDKSILFPPPRWITIMFLMPKQQIISSFCQIFHVNFFLRWRQTYLKWPVTRITKCCWRLFQRNYAVLGFSWKNLFLIDKSVTILEELIKIIFHFAESFLVIWIIMSYFTK